VFAGFSVPAQQNGVTFFTHYIPITREHPICANGAGYARAIRTNGEKALILRAQSARKISALNKKCTSGMLPYYTRSNEL
jgi:hypothetical protein